MPNEWLPRMRRAKEDNPTRKEPGMTEMSYCICGHMKMVHEGDAMGTECITCWCLHFEPRRSGLLNWIRSAFTRRKLAA